MFRAVSVSCTASGKTWSIDTNQNLPGCDNGKTWDGFTRMALQAFQAYGIPVFPCTGALQAMSSEMRDYFHFRDTMKVQHVLAEIVADQLHLALLHSSIKELAHGLIRPWGPHKVSRTDATD